MLPGRSAIVFRTVLAVKRMTFAFVLTACVSAAGACIAGVNVQKEIERDSITACLGEWRAREDKLRSIEFSLEITAAADSVYSTALEEVRRNRSSLKRQGFDRRHDHAPLVAATTNTESQTRFARDGHRLMFEEIGKIYNSSEGRFIERTKKTVFDGKDTRNRRITTEPSSPVEGNIFDGRELSELNLLFYLPIRWWLGLLWKDTAGEMESSISATEAGADNDKVFVLYDNSASFEMWTDASRDFIVTRFVGSPQSTKRWQIDVTYRNYSDFGWVPDDWTLMTAGAHGKKVTKCTMKDVKINQPVVESAFDITFPPNATVWDYRDEKGERTYKIGEKGEEIPLLGKRITDSSKGWMLWANVLVVFILAALVLLQNYVRKRAVR